MVVTWHWVGFGILVAVLLGLDLLVFHRHDRAPIAARVGGLDRLLVRTGRRFQRPGLVGARPRGGHGLPDRIRDRMVAVDG